MMKILKFFLWLLVFLAIAAIIWFVGPLVAIGSWRPFESATVRLILIGVVLLLWIIRRTWVWWRARQTNAQLVRGLVKSEETPAGPTASEEEVAALSKRFEDAINVLKTVRPSSAGKKRSLVDLISLSGRQYLYQLPWYIFIGAPGSGKTTALINSGLQFPLAEKLGTASVRGVAGTRNCDWWFTDEAVLLDTAGRYTTQESDRAVDSAAWQGFLQLLRKSRPRRPINGVMVTVSVADLLQQSSQEREVHAAAIRKRLQELHEQFQIRFPIYVLVTKTDLLAGFMEFYGDAGKEERAQVWGMTFPYTENTAESPLPRFGSEYELLEQRVLDRLLDRMQTERDPAKRAQIFAFPQQLGTIKPLLGEFLEHVFTASKYEETPLLRGIYFTSGTQEGSPIDRVMGQLSRAFGMERKVLPPQASSGRSYFLNRLLHEVVFQEKNLAGTNLRWERRRALIKWSVYVATTLFAIGASIAWVMSYSRNNTYVAAVDQKIPVVKKLAESVPEPSTTDIATLLPTLHALRDISTTPVTANGVPTSMGFGLYQGRKLDAAADQSYRRMLQDTLLPRISLRIEEQLRTVNPNNLEFAYEALKAYLMLHDSNHFDADAVKAWVSLDWDHSLPRDVTVEQREELMAHLSTLLERGALNSPMPADENLVQSVRTMLEQYSLANRVYSRLKRVGVGRDVPEFSLTRAAGPGAALVFTRRSGEPLTKGIPGMYTYDGYYKAFRKESEKVANQLADEEGWVLGLKTDGTLGRLKDPDSRTRLIEEVRRLYLADYAKIWLEYLKDITLIRASTLQQSIEQARILAAPDNPLQPFLRAASRETTLVRPEKDKNVLDKTVDNVKSARDNLGDLLGTDQAPAPTTAKEPIEYMVDRQFEGLRRFVTPSSPGQPAPIDGALGLINELQAMLNASDTAIKAHAAPPPSDVPNKLKSQAPSMPDPVSGMLQSLSETSARQANSAIAENTSTAITAQVGEFCRQAIDGRYPLVRSSSRDITQDDFATLFGPGGKIDDFFQKNLAQLVDTSTKPWTYRKINDVPLGNSGSLIEFQRAATIRDVFFRSGGRTPGLKLDFKPLEMDAAITQFILDVDGQLVKYAHGPQVPQTVQWPGPKGSTQVRVQIQPPGNTGVSGTTTEGAWAMFRMFDKAQIEPTAQPERFRVTFNVDGRRATFEVVASSVQNPFRLRELEQFRCP